MTTALLNQFQLDLIEVLSDWANILVILGNKSEDHMFFTFVNFEGVNRSNLGSVEHNQIKGVNITTLVRNQQAGTNISQPAALQSLLTNFIELRPARTVKYANLPYLIFST